MSVDRNNWYHGKLSRTDAEEVLKKDGNAADGLFLVRDSNSAVGDFVLSVLDKGEVIHYQIRKHGEDAFFSIDEHTISHGLDTLIEYYRENDGLSVKLTAAVVKDAPPHDSKRHGRENLLHRATKEGNYTVVTELLKCGYRSLEAKNGDGQTAVHLACINQKTDILEKLIESGASVNCRDTAGYSPLHYACHKNCIATIGILIEKGGANFQMRTTTTGWVPLHEAASRGHVDSVKALLALNAPLKPRTRQDETPETLAAKNGHVECQRVLSNYEIPAAATKKSDWFHGTLSRNKAVDILKKNEKAGNSGATFFVRVSDQSATHVLSLVFLGQTYHFQIQKNEKGEFYIDEGPYLNSLEHLIEYYSTMPDGLPTKLEHAVTPEPSPPLPETPHPFSSLPRGSGRRNVNIFEAATLPMPPKKKNVILTGFGETFPELPVLSEQPVKNELESGDEDVLILGDNIILREIIGEGEFGSVHKAILQNRNGFEDNVAVKTLRCDLMNDGNRDEFLRESKVMMKMQHPCIVKFIGICLSPLLMVQEMAALGSMLRYLIDFPALVSPTYELKLWASQIACGMRYLEEKRFVHRDLAARNILLATKFQVKISDFGLSRTLSTDREYYRATKGGRWPIKWYAPESYNFGTFSSASDVWSFGITLWEMYSFGAQPYSNMKGMEVIALIESGGRLKKPTKCPPEVYQIMEQCWSYNSRNRPTFSELYEMFSTTPEYINVNDFISV